MVFNMAMLKGKVRYSVVTGAFRNGNFLDFLGHSVSSFLPHDVRMLKGHWQRTLLANKLIER